MNSEQFIPGIYRQHILAGVVIAGHQPVGIRRRVRYDSASRTAIVRFGSLTWVQDQLAADSMRDAWRHIAELGPIILGRQAPIRRRRRG